jgi:hypothetical protein
MIRCRSRTKTARKAVTSAAKAAMNNRDEQAAKAKWPK